MKATFFCAQAVAREMITAKQGLILNAASVAGRAGKPHILDYCASKFAAIGVTPAMALALAPHGVRVNAVGIVDTDMWASIDWEWTALEGRPVGKAKQARVANIGADRDSGRCDQGLCVLGAGRSHVYHRANV